MAGQKIGDVECARVCFGVLGKKLAAVEFIAMGTGNASYVIVAADQLIDCPATAAIGIADQDQVKAMGPVVKFLLYRRCDLMRQVVQLRWHSRQLIVPRLPIGNCDQFAHDGATCDDADFHGVYCVMRTASYAQM